MAKILSRKLTNKVLVETDSSLKPCFMFEYVLNKAFYGKYYWTYTEGLFGTDIYIEKANSKRRKHGN